MGELKKAGQRSSMSNVLVSGAEPGQLDDCERLEALTSWLLSLRILQLEEEDVLGTIAGLETELQ